MNSTAKQIEDIPETRIRTLVIDDSPFMLKTFSQILEKAGNFDLVGTATDGYQALRYVTMLSPELVFTEMHMPHLNGLQATRYIKERERRAVVIITTWDDIFAARDMAEAAGADAFVSKRGNLRHQLLSVLQSLFGPGGGKRQALGGISLTEDPQRAQSWSAADDRLRLKRVTSPVMQSCQGEQTFREAHSAGTRKVRVLCRRVTVRFPHDLAAGKADISNKNTRRANLARTNS